jgi:hypothetical protein
MHRHVHVIADGVRHELPPETEGVILLNINSYAGGVRMWEQSGGGSDDEDGGREGGTDGAGEAGGARTPSFGASSMDDGMVAGA